MSQDLISQFISRTYVFKPFHDDKIMNHKVQKYRASHRDNNSSPEDMAESTHILQPITVVSKKAEKAEKEDTPATTHINITV